MSIYSALPFLDSSFLVQLEGSSTVVVQNDKFDGSLIVVELDVEILTDYFEFASSGAVSMSFIDLIKVVPKSLESLCCLAMNISDLLWPYGLCCVEY